MQKQTPVALTLQKLLTLGIAQASFVALTYSQILKFITFTLEVKRRLWSASHPETVLQRSLSGDKRLAEKLTVCVFLLIEL